MYGLLSDMSSALSRLAQPPRWHPTSIVACYHYWTFKRQLGCNPSNWTLAAAREAPIVLVGRQNGGAGPKRGCALTTRHSFVRFTSVHAATWRHPKRVLISRPVVPAREVVVPSVDAAGALPLTRRLQRAKSRKGRFLLATFQEVVESIRPDAACLQVPRCWAGG